MRELVVGTRASALALAQTRIVCDALRRLDPSLAIRVEKITTTGDARADVPLSALGRGIFVTEIEDALRAKRIDFAVHSAKDLPSTLDDDLTLGAILKREDARDVLVSRAGTLRELPPAARVGTSSPRRACQLRAFRPDLDLRNVRGNVDTRLRKLAAGEFDALVLAAAGLIRLGRESEATEWLDVETMIPCVGQGALAVEARADDDAVVRLLGQLDDAATRTAVTGERAFLAELGAGCLAAVAAHARIEDGRVRITAMIGSVDGRHMKLVRAGDAANAAHLGSSAARELLRAGAAMFLTRADSPLAGVRVAVTRPTAQSAELIALLRARGAEPVSCPTIAIEPVRDTTRLDAVLRDTATSDWIVFTSANAVRAVADRLESLGLALPEEVQIAAVGAATADALASHVRQADFVSATSNADALGSHLPDVAGRDVIFPCGDLAHHVLAERLRKRGARVQTVVAYRTVAGAGVGELAALIVSGKVDAVLFASPSSVKFAAVELCAARALAASLPVIVCIGSTTAVAARDLGVAPDAIATTQSVGGIVESLERCIAARTRSPQPVER